MKKQNTDLIPINGETLCFPKGDFNEDVIQQNCDTINKFTFQSKLSKLHVAQNCRIIVDNGKEHLKEIMKKSKFKKFFKEAMTIAKEDLGFTLDPKAKPTPSMDNDLDNRPKNRLQTPAPKRFN